MSFMEISNEYGKGVLSTFERICKSASVGAVNILILQLTIKEAGRFKEP